MAGLAVALAVALLLLTGCDRTTLMPVVWRGVADAEGVDAYPVEVAYGYFGDAVLGSYYLDGATEPSGRFEGVVSGDHIAGTLRRPDCVQAFDGGFSRERLQMFLEPQECPGGRAEVWDLVRHK